MFLGLIGLATGVILRMSGTSFLEVVTKWSEVLKEVLKAVVLLVFLFIIALWLAFIVVTVLHLEMIEKTGINLLKLGEMTFLGVPIYMPGTLGGLFYGPFYGFLAMSITTLSVQLKTRRWLLSCLYGPSMGLLFGVASGFAAAGDEGFLHLGHYSDITPISLEIGLAMHFLHKALAYGLYFVCFFSLPFFLVRSKVNEKVGIFVGSLMASVPVLLSGGIVVGLITYMTSLFIGHISLRRCPWF